VRCHHHTASHYQPLPGLTWPHRATPCATQPTQMAAVHRHTPHHTAANMCEAPVHTPEGAIVALSTGTRFQPPGNVHAPYYPLKGPYSSSDPATIRDHIQEMLSCNVTVLVSRHPHSMPGPPLHDMRKIQHQRKQQPSTMDMSLYTTLRAVSARRAKGRPTSASMACDIVVSTHHGTVDNKPGYCLQR
jgi:hypothetical protein